MSMFQHNKIYKLTKSHKTLFFNLIPFTLTETTQIDYKTTMNEENT